METGMKVHAIQTGSVRIKTAQIEAPLPGALGIVGVLLGRDWSGWLPTYAWAIEHRDGVIVVDTGQATYLLEEVRKSLHPFLRSCAEFEVAPELEVGPQLKAAGIGPHDVKQVVLTHMHVDHDAGLSAFPHSRIRVARAEMEGVRGFRGVIKGLLPKRWPDWFDPEPLDLTDGPFGPFAASRRLVEDGSVMAVATPGHTANHVSVIVEDGPEWVFLAGDTSYTQALMMAGKIDGVSTNAALASRTLATIRQFAGERPVIYLPTHDPEAGRRLANREIVPLYRKALHAA
jgi:glyoxylase-like metal-dependent hydrolase (beta-lactamase superfamily II)